MCGHEHMDQAAKTAAWCVVIHCEGGLGLNVRPSGLVVEAGDCLPTNLVATNTTHNHPFASSTITRISWPSQAEPVVSSIVAALGVSGLLVSEVVVSKV